MQGVMMYMQANSWSDKQDEAGSDDAIFGYDDDEIRTK